MDLRAVPFDAWLAFIFDHPVRLPGDEETKAWYWTQDLDISIDPIRQIVFLTRFCDDPTPVLARYSVAEIDQGLWYIFSGGGEDITYRLLWSPEVPWELRERCIAAIPNLWPALFEVADVGTMSYMLWDSLAYGYYCGNCHPGDDPEDHRVQDSMHAALKSQLASEHPLTQRAALHGLGHLSHPDLADDINEFLNRPYLDEEIREYAAAILAGEFQ
jgi:hypothetical protein